MYKCSRCGTLALVVKDSPIMRGCDCFEEVERDPISKFEKFCAFFGRKYYRLKRCSIVTDMSATAQGTGNCKM